MPAPPPVGSCFPAVDAIVAARADVERYKDSHALVFKSALREGRVIYESR
ncbi:MAG: hypothetical protein J4F33_08115 [Alphaproteobacteria bacterium]|nr:hypothetical protein [Alphaproteobacteria bacterium]